MNFQNISIIIVSGLVSMLVVGFSQRLVNNDFSFNERLALKVHMKKELKAINDTDGVSLNALPSN